MRIQGRLLRPSTLAERRVLTSLGVDALRVPRRLNPFAVARHIRKLAGGSGDWARLRQSLRLPKPTPELPDSTSEPTDAVVAA